jgi:hypothetical protein
VTICLSQSGTVATQPPQETKVPGFEPHQWIKLQENHGIAFANYLRMSLIGIQRPCPFPLYQPIHMWLYRQTYIFNTHINLFKKD